MQTARVPLAERRGVLPLEKGKANEVCEGIVVPDRGANLAIGTIATSNPLPRFCGKKKARANTLALAFFSFGGERGIRTPGTRLGYARFPSVCLRPLNHLSKRRKLL